jgi:Mn2+/Fe2+ NRAMP family transporter
VPLVALAHHPAGPSRVLGGPHEPADGAVLVVIALIGTTVAPWQLFFQQSNVVDKRITTRWLAYERVDTTLGALLFALVAVAALVAGSASGAGVGHSFADAGRVASDLRHAAGPWAGALFAVLLLNGSILGAAAVTLSTSYAIGDVTGTRHSLHRGWRDARTFHGTYVATVALAATIVLLPGVPLGIVTTGVQALTGVLLPSALVFLLLLCNDRAVLGPRVNARWLNVVAGTFVSTFLVFSALLVVTTLFPLVALGTATIAFVVGPAAAVGAAFGWRLVATGSIAPSPGLGIDPLRWTMPPIETLPAPVPTRARQIGLVVLRVYLLLAVVAVVARVIRLIMGA